MEVFDDGEEDEVKSCGLALMPETPYLYVGYVTETKKSVKTSYMAASQLIPVHPPMPALRIRTSSLGIDPSSFLESLSTDRRLVRSTCAAPILMRLERGSDVPLETLNF